MPNTEFLRQIADYYIDKNIDLSGYTFVFPNKRSALFARKYLQNKMRGVGFMPRMISITYFTQMLNGTALASNAELVFILYKVYCKVLKKTRPDAAIPEFDSFYFWGNILLKDFNDADAYMVDTDQLFPNLKSIKELSSNFLTDEQIEVAKLLWGEDSVHQDKENFWKQFKDPQTGSPLDKFITFWEVMGDLYREFVATLDNLETPLSYSGLQSRRACEKVKDMGVEDFNGRRFAFIGFNVLSTARIMIFKRLKLLRIAEFFWDTASPFLHVDEKKVNRAARFIMPLAQRFPSPEGFELQPINKYPDIKYPDIEIVSVPSGIGQTKVAAQYLDEFAKEAADPNNMIDTTVVLADEKLLTPMLQAIPDSVGDINVTLSMNYSSSPFAALMSAIISMHLRGKIVHGSYHYFYQDVMNVLSQPHITMIMPETAKEIRRLITEDRLYNVSANEMIAKFPETEFLLRPSATSKNFDEVKSYIDNLLETLSLKFDEVVNNGKDDQFYELEILRGYRKVVDELSVLVQRYKISISEHTFLQIIERTLALSTVNFAGMPLKGMQIMGIMDTRALDFKNVIMLSMNERIFPKRNYNPSLIPTSLRKGYGLPTQEHEECSYAYQFYRLLARAEKVKLIYDNRTGGITSGEMSRYLSQLLYIYDNLGIRVTNVEIPARGNLYKKITIDKTHDVIAELRRFQSGGDLNLSASALKTYNNCPLCFYLQYVKRLRDDNDVLEYIDAASYGTILHHVVEKLYAPYKNQNIGEATLGKLLNSDINTKVLEEMNKWYYRGRYTGKLDRIPGEGQVTAELITRYIKAMIKAEKNRDAFRFIAAEAGEHQKFQWEVNSKYTVNFKMSIDRIDCLDNTKPELERPLVFIDYKTGGDNLSCSNLDDLFSKHDCGGMFQLLLYSYVYAKKTGHKGSIKPVIYKMQSMAKEGIIDLKFSKMPLQDYRDIEQYTDAQGATFYERLEDLIDRILEEENKYPFTQTENIDNCEYCQFKTICGRYKIKNY